MPVAEHFVALLADSGVSHGLVGPREAPRLWTRHVLNCAVLGELLVPGADVIDIGSGAGLPGIAVAIARPDLVVYLVEPLLRRATWLENTLAQLGLANARVHRARAEELAGTWHARYVTARAVASLPKLVAWSMPLLRPGGELLAIKGQRADEEVRALLPSAGMARGEIVSAGTGIVDPPTTVVRLLRR